ncbi:ImmA/IrrE family metallo-endopeptidase [Luteimonas sp. A277]
MAELSINAKWMAAESGEPEVAATAAQLNMCVDDICLTRNQDVWAETVRDNVFVSAYPLATWFASSWWRLNHEPLPPQRPGYDWRMAHELGAAGHGFVWPRIIFIPDGEAIYVWAEASMTPGQSVQYLSSLRAPKLIAPTGFQQSVERFMQSVLARLDAKDLAGSNLAQLWAIVQAELADPEAARRRKLEAKLGFDPEECPEDALNAALQWESRVGDVALSELAPAIAASGADPDLAVIGELANADGIVGAPEFSFGSIDHLDHGAPWERAVHDARALRQQIGNINGPILNGALTGLMGLSSDAVADFAPRGRSPVAVAMPLNDRQLKFVPRRRSPAGKRFELARFLGEHLRSSICGERWLVSTDLGTSSQKYQRAFAAEFLCPIDALASFLNGDFSSYAIEEAAEKFDVSEQTVTSLLRNNDYIQHHSTEIMPYQVAA